MDVDLLAIELGGGSGGGSTRASAAATPPPVFVLDGFHEDGTPAVPMEEFGDDCSDWSAGRPDTPDELIRVASAATAAAEAAAARQPSPASFDRASTPSSLHAGVGPSGDPMPGAVGSHETADAVPEPRRAASPADAAVTASRSSSRSDDFEDDSVPPSSALSSAFETVVADPVPLPQAVAAPPVGDTPEYMSWLHRRLQLFYRVDNANTAATTMTRLCEILHGLCVPLVRARLCTQHVWRPSPALPSLALLAPCCYRTSYGIHCPLRKHSRRARFSREVMCAFVIVVGVLSTLAPRALPLVACWRVGGSLARGC